MSRKKEDGDFSLENLGIKETPEKPDNPNSTATNGKAAVPEGKIRIRNETLKNGDVFLGNGELAGFDADGIAEIETAQAKRLLGIPGYEEI